MTSRVLLPLALLLALAACREEAALRPDPVAMTPESIGHFCQMNLMEHGGPKAQVHLKGQPNPLFFGQARDALAFRLLPEQEGEITAVYVSDMAAAPSWDAPGTTNWIDATQAFYVTGSARAGGMGAPETIPFATEAAARSFAAAEGGTIQRMDEISPEVVLAADGAPAAPQDADAETDADYRARLEALAGRPEETTR